MDTNKEYTVKEGRNRLKDGAENRVPLGVNNLLFYALSTSSRASARTAYAVFLPVNVSPVPSTSWNWVFCVTC